MLCMWKVSQLKNQEAIMAEIEEEAIFYTKADAIEFKTRTNGDILFIRKLHLNQSQATSLAWLINADGGVELEFQVKRRET